MFDLEVYKERLIAVTNSTTNTEKGESFELLAEYLFNCLSGIQVRERDILMPSEEIDLLLWNARTEEVLGPWDATILVECKNWSSPVGSSVLDNFIMKLRRRRLSTGIFIAANGVTGDFVNGNNQLRGAVAILHEALSMEGIRIIVIRMADLQGILSIDDLRELIKDRYCKLIMRKVF
ncbi:restriction endonuclease [Bacillus sp. NTK071]|uniref:restriction endonuclease n=1 Tax=Bacillus sp. NTK071 TaxID=2802175 RepID=UPI001A8FFBCF|nr:restriction endonuclease [Bacillus sp. NTK071]MBN8209381.1 restriction endonuclease [Bacillus sp. NTK071]